MEEVENLICVEHGDLRRAGAAHDWPQEARGRRGNIFGVAFWVDKWRRICRGSTRAIITRILENVVAADAVSHKHGSPLVEHFVTLGHARQHERRKAQRAVQRRTRGRRRPGRSASRLLLLQPALVSIVESVVVQLVRRSAAELFLVRIQLLVGCVRGRRTRVISAVAVCAWRNRGSRHGDYSRAGCGQPSLHSRRHDARAPVHG